MKDDVEIAIQSAVTMAERSGRDVALMPDLSIKFLKDADQDPLEIIRYSKGE
jgi:hypothetical protein